MAPDTLRARLAEIRALRLSDSLKERVIGVPWAYLKGNHCADRAFLTFIGLALPPGPLSFRTELSASTVRRVSNRPAIESARVSFVGDMSLKHELGVPGGRSASFTLKWTNHEAVVVNVDNELKVVDLAMGQNPLSIVEWMENVRPGARRDCPQLTVAEAGAVRAYNVCRFNGWMPGRPRPVCVAPSKPCGYVFRPDHGYNAAASHGEWGSMAYVFSEAAFAMSSDMAEVVEALGPLDVVNEAPHLRSRLSPE